MAPSIREAARQLLSLHCSRSTVLYSLATALALLGIFVFTLKHMTARTQHDRLLNVEKAHQSPPAAADGTNPYNDIIPAVLLQETSAHRRIQSSSEDPLASVYYPVTSGQLAVMAEMDTTHREQIQALVESVLEFESSSRSKD